MRDTRCPFSPIAQSRRTCGTTSVTRNAGRRVDSLPRTRHQGTRWFDFLCYTPDDRRLSARWRIRPRARDRLECLRCGLTIVHPGLQSVVSRNVDEFSAGHPPGRSARRTTRRAFGLRADIVALRDRRHLNSAPTGRRLSRQPRLAGPRPCRAPTMAPEIRVQSAAATITRPAALSVEPLDF